MLAHLSLLYCLSMLSDVTASVVSSRSLHQRAASVQDCRDINSDLHAKCWDVLYMDAWMNRWNATTKSCHSDELWANCFMRKAGMAETEQGGKIGCAQVGPNTCPEPTQAKENSASASIEMRYGAYSIWSLQNYMTSIYNNLQSTTGLSKMESTYTNLSAHEVTAKRLLASLLFSESTSLAEAIGRMVTTNLTIPESEIAIPGVSQAPKALGQALAAYLESFMTNFTLGGFAACARHGVLMNGETFGQ